MLPPNVHNDYELDASGEECPVPVEMAADRLAKMKPGQVLCVRATDPVAPIDFEAWCMRERHEFLGAEQTDGVWEIRLRRG